MNTTKKIFKIIFFIFCLLILFYPLLQIRHTGFYFDDTYNSQTKGYIEYNNLSTLKFNQKIASQWFRQGRIIPGITYGYLLWVHLFTSLESYKCIIIIANLFSIILFGLILKRIFNSNKLFLISLTIIPIFFQFQQYPESVTSFGLLLQLIWINFCVSILFLIKYLKNKQKKLFFISIFFYLVSLSMFYEITYILFPVVILISFIQQNRNLKKTIKISLPYVFLSVIFTLINFLVLSISKSNTHYNGTTFNFNLNLIFQTFLKQILASFPGVYYFYNRKLFNLINKLDYIYVFLVFITSIIIFKKNNIKKIKYVFLLGILLISIPAIPISLSLKYQQDLRFGIGYLPVYIQYFGAFCLIISLFLLATKIKNKIIKIILDILFSLIISFFAFINIENNKIVTEDMNSYYKYPREILKKSLENNLLEKIEEGSTIVTLNQNPWDSNAFYLANSNKKYNIESIKTFTEKTNNFHEISNFKLIENIHNPPYIVGYQLSNKNIGSVFIGKLSKLLFNTQNNEFDLLIKDVKIFTIGNRDYKYLSYQNYEENKTVSEKVQELNDNQTNLITFDSNKEIDPKTIYLTTNWIKNPNLNNYENQNIFLNGIKFKWEDGFSGLEKLGDDNWRWCSSLGLLKIINFNSTSKKITISMSINSGYQDKSNLYIKIDNQEKNNLMINNQPTNFSKNLTIKPELTQIEFNTDAKQIINPNDTRDLRIRINNFLANFP